MKKLTIISVILSFFSLLYADVLGEVVKVKGIVKVKHKDSIKKTKVKKGYKIQTGDIISTYSKAFAVIKLKDGSDIVLDEKSILSFEDKNKLAQNSGKIFYKITKRDRKNGLKIKTEFAIIGIKGTTFIIKDDNTSKQVALKEGLIGIESIKEEFKLYRKKVLEEYEEYKNKQLSEFEKYKAEANKQIAIMTKEFELESGSSVSFGEDNEAKEGDIDNDEFEKFEKLLE